MDGKGKQGVNFIWQFGKVVVVEESGKVWMPRHSTRTSINKLYSWGCLLRAHYPQGDSPISPKYNHRSATNTLGHWLSAYAILNSIGRLFPMCNLDALCQNWFHFPKFAASKLNLAFLYFFA
jgi:hypothetical protein